MAKILPFAKSRIGRKAVPPEGTGEIVIFPGIRVEYHDRVPAPEAKRRRRRARRNPSEDVLSA